MIIGIKLSLLTRFSQANYRTPSPVTETLQPETECKFGQCWKILLVDKVLQIRERLHVNVDE